MWQTWGRCDGGTEEHCTIGRDLRHGLHHEHHIASHRSRKPWLSLFLHEAIRSFSHQLHYNCAVFNVVAREVALCWPLRFTFLCSSCWCWSTPLITDILFIFLHLFPPKERQQIFHKIPNLIKMFPFSFFCRRLFGSLLHPPPYYWHPSLLPGAGSRSEDQTWEYRGLELRLSPSGWNRDVKSDGKQKFFLFWNSFKTEPSIIFITVSQMCILSLALLLKSLMAPLDSRKVVRGTYIYISMKLKWYLHGGIGVSTSER